MLVKTLKVKSKLHPDLPFVLINETDYDERVHKIIGKNSESDVVDIDESLTISDVKNQQLARTSSLKNKNKDIQNSSDI